jgi:hypothetical protein
MRLFTAVYSVSCNQVETTNCFCGWFRWTMVDVRLIRWTNCRA